MKPPQMKHPNKEIYYVTSIFKFRVEMEKFTPSKKASQCYQQFYHTAANYHINPRCSECGDNNFSQDCTPDVPKQPPKCCNWGLSHPFSYESCFKFPTKAQFRKKYAKATGKSNTDPIVKNDKIPPQNYITESKHPSTSHRLNSFMSYMDADILNKKINCKLILSPSNSPQFNNVLAHIQEQNTSSLKIICLQWDDGNI